MRFTTLILTTSFIFVANALLSQISGCTDPLAYNYNADATQNDGSCVYLGASISPMLVTELPIELKETSGLLFYNNSIITHIDDSDTHLYQIDVSTDNAVSSVSIPNVSNTDWEDLAEDENYFYIGDFGNNVNGNRTNMRIFRIAKNEWDNNPVVDTIHFSYELQTDFSPQGNNATNFDCEAFIVTADSVYLFTKEWNSLKTSLYKLSKSPGQHLALFHSELNVGGLVTGATHHENLNLVVLTGYSTTLAPFVYLLYDFESDNFFSGNKRKIALNIPYHQVEGIAAKNEFEYYISNEAFTFGNMSVTPKLQTIDLTQYLQLFVERDFVGVDEAVIQSCFIAPNPAKQAINLILPTISTNQEPYKLSLIDSNGKEVFKKSLAGNQTHTTIALSGMQSGTFSVLVQDIEGRVVLMEKLQIVD